VDRNNIMKAKLSTLCALASCLLPMSAVAQEAQPLLHGPYLAPMGSYVKTGDAAFDDGVGGTFAAGYRQGHWAVEGSGVYGSYAGAGAGKDTDVVGGSINGLLFPFSGLPQLFLLLGGGAVDIDRHPQLGHTFSLTTLEGGAGYLVPLRWGNYQFGIRADARYRYGKREKEVRPQGDPPIPTEFEDTLFNLGLQLPLAFATPVVAEAPAPVAVVAVQDSDGDGVVDPDDQCPDTPMGTPVNDKGCPLPPPPPPCKKPAPGERVSLEGCGTGDTIVLHGVNFEFDRAQLTVNARTLLDNVAEELHRYADIQVEVGGHTDAKGTDAYNQRLSEARAESVLSYLADKGVARERMTAVGYGESQPLADNESDEGRERNRRVELKITAAQSAAAAPAAAAESTLPEPAPAAAPAEEATAPVPAAEATEGAAEEVPFDPSLLVAEPATADTTPASQAP
jgi:outer membrane protein OmpA-like peptidoglycan-associated protein